MGKGGQGGGIMHSPDPPLPTPSALAWYSVGKVGTHAADQFETPRPPLPTLRPRPEGSAVFAVYRNVRRAVIVTVRLAPLPRVTCGRTKATGWLTCSRPAAVKERAAPEGLDRVK